MVVEGSSKSGSQFGASFASGPTRPFGDSSTRARAHPSLPSIFHHLTSLTAYYSLTAPAAQRKMSPQPSKLDHLAHYLSSHSGTEFVPFPSLLLLISVELTNHALHILLLNLMR